MWLMPDNDNMKTHGKCWQLMTNTASNYEHKLYPSNNCVSSLKQQNECTGGEGVNDRGKREGRESEAGAGGSLHNPRTPLSCERPAVLFIECTLTEVQGSSESAHPPAHLIYLCQLT